MRRLAGKILKLNSYFAGWFSVLAVFFLPEGQYPQPPLMIELNLKK
jgi:hypothetical protein